MTQLSIAVTTRSPVRSGSHLKQIGDTWYYRRVVPPEARHLFGKSEVKFSLSTTRRVEAERLEKQHDVDFEKTLTNARESAADGWPTDAERRREKMVDSLLYEHVTGDRPVAELLQFLPETDRSIVADQIERLSDIGKTREANLESLFDDLDEMILETGQDWPFVRAGILAVVRNYLDGLRSKHDLDFCLGALATGRPPTPANSR